MEQWNWVLVIRRLHGLKFINVMCGCLYTTTRPILITESLLKKMEAGVRDSGFTLITTVFISGFPLDVVAGRKGGYYRVKLGATYGELFLSAVIVYGFL
jgi:hypothetical protein